MAREILRAGNLAVQGVSKREKLDNITMPILTDVAEDWRGAGGHVDQEFTFGYEKIVAKFTILGLDVDLQKTLTLKSKSNKLFIIYAYAEKKGGEKVRVKVTMRGKLKQTNQDTIDGKTLAKAEFDLVCNYYKYEQAGEVIHEIDVDGTITMVGGVDETAEINELLGQ